MTSQHLNLYSAYYYYTHTIGMYTLFQDLENTQYEDSSETILTEGSSSILQLQQAETPQKSSEKQLNPSDPHDIGIESEPSQRNTVRQLVPAGKKPRKAPKYV